MILKKMINYNINSICHFLLCKDYIIHQLGVIKSKEKLQKKVREKYQNVSEKETKTAIWL